jgi:hypothetical protein
MNPSTFSNKFITNRFILKNSRAMETLLETDDVTWVPDAQDAPDVEQTGSIIWNYYKVDGAQSKQGGAKNAMCTFCDSSFTGCSAFRAFAHILGRAVLGQKKANIGACVPIRREDDAGYCLDPEFHSHDHAGCPEALTDFFTMCDKIHGAGSARNWSAHGHIHSEVRNRLAPATTEKLVYIYSNRKALAAASQNDELKMYTWDNE